MKFNIELINVGRNDACCKFVTGCEELIDAEFIAVKESRKHLMSAEVTLEPISDEKNSYHVFAGFRKVGKVIIKEVSG